jgi:hypothetical protein
MKTQPRQPMNFTYEGWLSLTWFLISLAGGDTDDNNAFEYETYFHQGWMPLEAAREFLTKTYGYTGKS